VDIHITLCDDDNFQPIRALDHSHFYEHSKQ